MKRILSIVLVLGIMSFAGILAAEDKQPAPPIPAAAEQPAPAAPAPLSEVKLFFEPGKADLPADIDKALAPAVEALKANAGSKVDISGFVDRLGDPVKNEELAKARATAVLNKLKAAGITEDRVNMKKPEAITGKGSDAEARRVEVTVQPPPPPKIDTGDTAWMIVATALVMLMTLPGLALFYGGMAKRKDSLNTMAMSFVAYAIVSVLWIFYGYSLAFNVDIGGIIGSPSKVFMSGIGVKSISDLAKTIPEFIFIVYQLTFAAITVALASGSYIERMKFSAWVLFCILWMTFVYVPVAHWVWGGGFLGKLGALDFAGGTVVHINAGVAGLVGALLLGKRREATLIPSNLTLVVIGAGLLWFGWFGFNAGSALGAGELAGAAFINTNTATAVAAVVWMLVDWAYAKKATVLGLASGAVAGLVAITPAAGFVNINGAMVIGAVAGSIPYFAVALLKPKLGYDDALDAFGIHGIAGTLGALLTGIFADPAINDAGKGLLFGNPGQLWIQLIAVGVTMVYTAVATFVIFMIIKAFVGLRVDVEEEIAGLDEGEHGEKAYNLM